MRDVVLLFVLHQLLCWLVGGGGRTMAMRVLVLRDKVVDERGRVRSVGEHALLSAPLARSLAERGFVQLCNPHEQAAAEARRAALETRGQAVVGR